MAAGSPPGPGQVLTAVAASGFAIGWWLFLIGALMTMFTTIGFVFEYYRGHYAH